MDINRLSSTMALISSLRRGAPVGKGAASGKVAATGKAEGGASNIGNAASMTRLRSQLVEAARGVDLQDAVAVRQARRRFIRAILLWEFGPGLREHPEWQTLLEGMERTLDEAAGTSDPAFLELLRSLQANRR